MDLLMGGQPPEESARRVAPAVPERLLFLCRWVHCMRGYLQARVGVKALIRRRGRVLLLRRSRRSPQYPGYWDLPGGGVEVGESLGRALSREVREETGLHVRIGPPIHAAIVPWPTGDGRRVPSLGLTYLCEAPRRGVPRVDAREHSEFAWVAPSDLGRYRMSRLCSEAVQSAVHRRIPREVGSL